MVKINSTLTRPRLKTDRAVNPILPNIITRMVRMNLLLPVSGSLQKKPTILLTQFQSAIASLKDISTMDMKVISNLNVKELEIEDL